MLDPYDNLYILDKGNKRIQKWPPGSAYGITVVSMSSMSNPYGISFSQAGNLIVADTHAYRIISFPVQCREFSFLSNVPYTTRLLLTYA